MNYDIVLLFFSFAVFLFKMSANVLGIAEGGDFLH